MSDIYRSVGHVIARWSEASPLEWDMTTHATNEETLPEVYFFDLSLLAAPYASQFLLAVKDALQERLKRVSLATIFTEYVAIREVLSRIASADSGRKFKTINSDFVKTLVILKHQIPATYLYFLRKFFKQNRENHRIFEAELKLSDFPRVVKARGRDGERMHSILSKSFSRATLVHVLNAAEAAVATGEINFGSYAFLHLSLNVFCRPENYRRLILSDLRIDRDPVSGTANYFLEVHPAKTRIHNPKKLVYRLNSDVGQLLSMQREAVVRRYGHLAPISDSDSSKREFGRLALFPATRLTEGGRGWVADYSNKRFGMLPRSGFFRSYLWRVAQITGVPLNCNAIRHTIGTQLAMTGCSASTIQAVLKHSTDTSAKLYVDIAFEGSIDALSESLEPSFDEFFPVFKELVSTQTAIPESRRIESEDFTSGEVETTGFCGRDVACHYAPIACYECHRFIPCFDADHSINIRIVDAEILKYVGHGRAMEHEIARWRNIREKIVLVQEVCERRVAESRSGVKY